MDRKLAAALAVLAIPALAWADIIHQESFEAAPVTGTTYEVVNAFDDGVSDYVIRQDKTGTLRSQYTTHPSSGSVDGDYYWIMEDTQATPESTADGRVIFTIVPVDVSAYSNLQVTVALQAIFNDYEVTDGFWVYVKTNGAASNLVGAVIGEEPNVTNLSEDSDFSGAGDGVNDTTANFKDFTYAITNAYTPAITSAQVIVVAKFNSGSEEAAIDNIRILGDGPPPVPEVFNFDLRFNPVITGTPFDFN